MNTESKKWKKNGFHFSPAPEWATFSKTKISSPLCGNTRNSNKKRLIKIPSKVATSLLKTNNLCMEKHPKPKESTKKDKQNQLKSNKKSKTENSQITFRENKKVIVSDNHWKHLKNTTKAKKDLMNRQSITKNISSLKKKMKKYSSQENPFNRSKKNQKTLRFKENKKYSCLKNKSTINPKKPIAKTSPSTAFPPHQSN